MEGVCVCVCVCVRERERERERGGLGSWPAGDRGWDCEVVLLVCETEKVNVFRAGRTEIMDAF